MGDDKTKGQLFTQLYLDRGQPSHDSELFRRRLGGYIYSKLWDDRFKLAPFIKIETGLTVPMTSIGAGVYLGFEEFIVTTPIEYVLNIITIVWRFLQDNHTELKKIGVKYEYISEPANDWKQFVARAIREENLAYRLDEHCGVHFLVDQEFEHNRVSILRGLDSPRYLGVKTAFEEAYRHFESTPRDTKASVRSMFESIEILTKLIVKAPRLNKQVVINKLKPFAQDAFSSDEIEAKVIGEVFDSFALWVDAIHWYRHGQGKSDPVAPSINLAVYVLSSGAAMLRWLLELERMTEGSQ